MKRREFLRRSGRWAAGSAMGLAGLPALLRAQDEEAALRQRAAHWHSRCLTVDTHVDTPLVMLRPGFDIGQSHDPREDLSQVDLPRMRAGGADAAFFAIYMAQGERTPEGNATARERAFHIHQTILDGLAPYQHLATLAKDPEGIERLRDAGKRIIVLGMENGWPIGRDLSLLETFHHWGVGYITLCHMLNNDICDSSTDAERGAEHGGLSEFGQAVVREMNRLGMMVDVSHVSDDAFDDCIRLSRAPIIASHSSCRAICDHARNLTDDQLRALRDHGGVAHMTMFNAYVAPVVETSERQAALTEFRARFGGRDLSPEEMTERRNAFRDLNRAHPVRLASIGQFADHIDHAVKIAGIEHVGIGSDFDGGGGVETCFDASEWPNLTLELVRRGYSLADLRKLWGENSLRVWRDIRKAAA
ncbi:MAG: dipeptidase [Opitutales bacterium]|nr:dipeptidase [Opitutales bacterium]